MILSSDDCNKIGNENLKAFDPYCKKWRPMERSFFGKHNGAIFSWDDYYHWLPSRRGATFSKVVSESGITFDIEILKDSWGCTYGKIKEEMNND